MGFWKWVKKHIIRPIKKIWKAIKKPVIAAATAAAVVATWGALAPGVTAMGALFSTTGAVITASAAATTATLNTGEGRQFIRRMGREVFDDVFGMSPRSAYRAAGIVSYMLVNTAFQFAFASVLAPKRITGMKDYNPDADSATARGILKEGKGVNYGIRPALHPKTGEVMNASKILYSGNEAVGLAAKALNIGGPQHLGVIMKGATMQSNMAALVHQPFRALSQGYFTFGISHQAVNITLLDAGYNTVITELGGAWSTVPSTFVYGPYGGGLTGAIAYEQISD